MNHHFECRGFLQLIASLMVALAVVVQTDAAELSYGVAATPNPVRQGSLLAYDFAVTNDGPDTALGVSLTSVLPTGSEFVSCDASQGSYTNESGTITCQLGTMLNGAVASVSIVARPLVLGSITNESSATCDNGSGRRATTVVTVQEANREPEIDLPGPHVLWAGASTSFVVTASDPNHDVVTLTNTVHPAGASFLGGIFSWTAPIGSAGTTQIVAFVADDGLGETNSVVTNMTTISVILPPSLDAFVSGPVVATSMKVNNLQAGAIVGDSVPAFSWHFGDSLNTNAPADFTRENLNSLTNNWAHNVAVGDLNGDGLPDVAVVDRGGGKNRAHINNGGSPDTWDRVDLVSRSSDSTYGVAIGDLTGDGLPDVVIGNNGVGESGQNYVIVNNGGPVHTWSRILLGPSHANWNTALAIADMTGDGRPDVIEANDNQSNYIVVNNGGLPSTWQRLNLQDSGMYTMGLAVGDLTGDGRPDVVFANRGTSGGSQNWVMLNNDANPSNWTRVALGSSLSDLSMSVAMGDVDGDGRLDVAVGNNPSGSATNHYILINNGGLPDTWPRYAMKGDGVGSCGIALADMTGDGLVDFVTVQMGHPSRVYVNDGTNPTNWNYHEIGPLQSNMAYRMTVADMNLDGRPDVVVANQTDMNYIHLNDADNMPFTQYGYRIQVARTAEALGSGPDVWDSGFVTSSIIGEGVGMVEQGAACVASGSYFWRIKLFSTSGAQGEWSDPQEYVFVSADEPVELVITTEGCTVEHETTGIELAGTCSSNAVGAIAWTNALTGQSGTIDVAEAWTIPSVPLAVGSNEITVSASNSLGSIASDSVQIVRMPEDMDEDGIPNWWETLYFGGGTNALASADADEDGLSNYQEYIANTDPTSTGSVFRLDEVVSSVSQTNHMVRVLTQPGRKYTIYFLDEELTNSAAWAPFADTNLGVWIENAVNPTNHTFVDDEGTGTTGSSPANGKRFYRVKVSLP